MTFDDVLEQIREVLATKGRVSYRALKVRFELTEEQLEACTAELIEAERVAVDENGKVLVWVGEQPVISSQSSGVSPQPPVAYTPAHLAERIRVVTVTDGERKTITALLANLKGSTALIEGLDPEEARQMLAAVYHWFTEGFETRDLQEAKASLDAFASSSV